MRISLALRDPNSNPVSGAAVSPRRGASESLPQNSRGFTKSVDIAAGASGTLGGAREPHRERSATRHDRPRERLERLGPSSLSDVELVALVLRTGDRRGDASAQARALLACVGGLEGLVGASVRQLASVPGVGLAKAASLCAAAEMATRIRAEPLPIGKRIQSPYDVHRHFLPRLAGVRRESFHVLLLDGRHRLMDEEVVSVGTLTASLVHPREVFRKAIREAAAAVLLVHNHPSGDPSPSAEDREVTKRLRAAGTLVGVEVVDHVIVAEGGHYSFRESGEPW